MGKNQVETGLNHFRKNSVKASDFQENRQFYSHHIFAAFHTSSKA